MLPNLLDRTWNALVALCDKEVELTRGGHHPKLAKLLGDQVEQLARELGFSPEQIQAREFRVVKNGRHVVKVITEGNLSH